MLLVGQLNNYILAYKPEDNRCIVLDSSYKVVDDDTFYNIIMKYKDPNKPLTIQIEDFSTSEENINFMKQTMYPDYCREELSNEDN